MRIICIIKRRVHSLLHRSSSDAELQGEIEIHIQQLTNEAIAAGMTEAEARAAALREFGSLEQIKEKCRDTRRVSWIQDFVQDLRDFQHCGCGAFAIASVSRSRSTRPDVQCPGETA